MFKLINHYLTNLSKMNELNDFPFGESNDMIRNILLDLPINIYLQRIILNYIKVRMNLNMEGHKNEIKTILFEEKITEDQLDYLDQFLYYNNKNSNIDLLQWYLLFCVEQEKVINIFRKNTINFKNIYLNNNKLI